ncbi:MAG: excinuclease ABC subunit UvrC [Flavobacteriales bacterium]
MDLMGKIRSLPSKPGIYQFYNNEGNVIYVWKAKNLKKRVSSYFNNKGKQESGKTQLLIKRITDVEYMIVDSELDALLLENNLIKKYQPKYNVQLKDDKTYPWICIKNERFPRVFSTRNPRKDGSEYYGPYASVKMMNTILDLVKNLYTLRTCNYDLTEENIENKKYRVCLEYHIGNCKGPCEGLQSEKDYEEDMNEIRQIIKGNIYFVTKKLKGKMKAHADAYEFEKADLIRNKLELLEKYKSRSTVVSPNIHNLEVFSFVDDEKRAFVNYMKVIKGAIVQGHTIEMKRKLEESAEEMLRLAIMELRQRYESNANIVLVPFEPQLQINKVKFKVPQRGEKKKLLDLSERNAVYYMKEKKKNEALRSPAHKKTKLLEKVQKDLRLKELPVHIECFDNSNIQGTSPASACVVFKKGQASKKDYRSFNIKSVDKPDDFASMKEVVNRRYTRLLKEDKSLPQLIVIDGGKGQLNAAVEALKELEIYGKTAIIGIAKRLEEIYYPEDSTPIYLDKRSQTLKLIQRLRNEAHRFSINHHRKRRRKKVTHTELEEVKGVGKKTIDKLLRHFKSLKRVKEAGKKETEKVIGKDKADKLFESGML